MLKKLRLKFVALNMATVAVVLAVVFTAICAIDYQTSLQKAYTALDVALEHADQRQDDASFDLATQAPDQAAPADGGANDSATRGEGTTALEIGGKHGGSEPYVPLAVYSLKDGATALVSSGSSAALSDDVLASATAALTDQPDGTGQLDSLGLYYSKKTLGNATYFSFADMCVTSGWKSLALTLGLVGAGALLAFLIISIFFSRWALKPVEASWKQQKQFVADASHELKTPLTVILANTSILLEHPEKSIASQSQWVESTQTEGERMQQLVGDLLLMARLEEDALKPVHEQLNLTDMVEGNLLQFESVAFENNVALTGNVQPNVLVSGDAGRMQRLVTTLIDNACKYVNEGGSVDVSLQATGGTVTLSVHNTGPAIAAEDLPHVFDRFYRADKARTRDNSGYGLGLAIAKAVAEEHGGTLTVASTEQTGTTFTATMQATA